MEHMLLCPATELKNFRAAGEEIGSRERKISEEVKAEVKEEDSTDNLYDGDKPRLIIGKYELVELDSDSEIEEDFHAVAVNMKNEEMGKPYIDQRTISEIRETERSDERHSLHEKLFPPSLCRLCAMPCNYMIDIFDSDTPQKSIVEKIHHCLPITVKQTDALTKQVCWLCLEKLESCYLFYETVTQAEKQLLLFHEQTSRNESPRKSDADANGDAYKIEMEELSDLDSDSKTPSSSGENQDTEASMETLNLSIISASQKTQNDCSIAPDSPTHSVHTREELNSDSGNDLPPHTRRQSKPGIQTHPNETIKSFYSLRKRKPQKFNRYKDGFLFYNEATEGHDSAPYSVDDQSIGCKLCKEVFETIEKLQTHAVTHASSNHYACCFCNEILEFEEQWKNHWLQHAADDTQGKNSKRRASIHSCIEYGKDFATAIGLQEHKLCHKPMANNPEHYKKCNIVLESETSLLQHMMVAHDDRSTSSGNVSGAQLRSEDQLNVRQLRRMVRCTYCRRKFPSDVRLEEHKKICFENKEKYPCSFCAKIFNWKSDLQRHMLSHTGERPHTCDICLKTFRRNSYMVKHRRLHTDERPFKCSVCLTTFHTSWKLQLHTEHVHLKKLHECSLCHKQFKNASSIKKHMVIHTKEKLYKCDLCQAQFTWSSTLYEHKRRSHGQRSSKNQVKLKK